MTSYRAVRNVALGKHSISEVFSRSSIINKNVEIESWKDLLLLLWGLGNISWMEVLEVEALDRNYRRIHLEFIRRMWYLETLYNTVVYLLAHFPSQTTQMMGGEDAYLVRAPHHMLKDILKKIPDEKWAHIWNYRGKKWTYSTISGINVSNMVERDVLALERHMHREPVSGDGRKEWLSNTINQALFNRYLLRQYEHINYPEMLLKRFQRKEDFWYITQRPPGHRASSVEKIPTIGNNGKKPDKGCSIQ